MGERERPKLPVRHLPALASVAGISWALVIGMVIGVDLARGPNLLSPLHLVFHGMALLTGIITFWPLERWLGLPGLTVEGGLGVWLLLTTIAIVPAPTGTLLDPPDMPVYALILFAVFLCVAVLIRPVIAVLSRRWLALKAWALDNRRVRREAYEVGLFAAATLALAALRILDPIKLIALAIILVLVEIILLSFIGVESTG
ncbi:MAG: hypothetical protein C0184_00515 [Chloroflexus aggregans]|uniref:Uncharacterized protein n=2 Tax=Chloroflexus TaxID=1107 RepID=A0A2J6XFT5_9CHLR|nr:MAG: hypothetical protein C0184_00515 [Chloroflexus aggregans]